MHTRRAGSHGFTLIELMMTLAIAAILAMLGAPALGNLVARVEASHTEAKIAGTLRHARNEAVMRNTRVLVCPSRDGHHCRSGDDWQHGWIVAGDADHDGQPDAGKQALAVVDAMPAGTRIITSAGRGHIVFQPTGSAGGSNVRFTICRAGQANGKSVVVANSGRVRVADPEPERVQECLAGLQ